MHEKGSRKPLPPLGDLSDPHGMCVLLQKYLEWMRIKNYSDRTVENRQLYLTYFIRWADDRGLTRPAEVTRQILERYQRYLHHYRKQNGDPLSLRSQHTRLVPLRAWFKWLAKGNHILYNPASELELPKLEYRLPKFVLTASEAEQVLNQTDVNEPFGVRDRAILETLYSTGMRRMELIHMTLADLERERGTVTVRQGKGNRDRVVPIGERALAWIDKYLREVRPSLLVGDSAGDVLFLTRQGESIAPSRLTELVREYVDAADIGKRGSCHLFRHTTATLMLEGGADIRFIQALLGHANLETTAIYARVSIRKLKEVHTETHPAKLQRDE